MAELKTKPTGKSVAAFIHDIGDEVRESCLYIKKLDDVDRGVLERLVAESVKHFPKLVAARSS
jgi:hypothetical protein